MSNDSQNDGGSSIVGGMDEPSESDSSRDGVLSYAAEWHAAAIGAAAGFLAVAFGQEALLALGASYATGRATGQASEHIRDVAREPAYFAAAVAVGGLLGLAVRALGVVAASPFRVS